MPAISNPNQLTAVIGFTLPQSALDHDASIYLTYDPAHSRPSEKVRVPVTDLRPDLEVAVPVPVHVQLAERGYAVTKHRSELLCGIPSEEGTQRYLDECAEVLKAELGATRVIPWNSVVRQNKDDVKLKDVPRQQGPEHGFIPTTRIQPIAGVAHVDQDEVWGHELCGKAAGKSADSFKRVQIVNIWRPLQGPVTNAPLAMADYRHLPISSLAKHGHLFGVGFDIHHDASQQWAYVRHQMPDEIIFLRCYDSDQGKDGEALYCGHVAVQVDGDAEGIEPGLIRPRESIEVRLVAIWE